jgi:hypothetical protein
MIERLSQSTKELIHRALERSWSAKTSVCYNPKIAPLSYGQCAPTAVVIAETFGGDILKTQVTKKDGTSVRHFYNRIEGQRYDFTRSQFDDLPDYWGGPIVYDDTLSSASEAMTEMFPGQLEEMKSAFKKALHVQNAG